MTFYTQIWFWLIIIAIIFLIIACILWATIKDDDSKWWIWAFMIAGVVLLIAGVIWGAVAGYGSSKQVAGGDDTEHVIHHHDGPEHKTEYMDRDGKKMIPHEIHTTEHIGTLYSPEGESVELHHSPEPVTTLHSNPSPLVHLEEIQ
jgi:hypothetical protein